MILPDPSPDQSIEQGRAAYEARRWREALEALRAADVATGLGPEDLELLATCSFMVGKVPEMLAAQERAYSGYLESGKQLPAARLALWVASNFASRGKLTEASGWVQRGSRILEPISEPSVEHGYLLLPKALRHVLAGELEEVIETSAEAASIGRQFQDQDLVALAAQTQARALLHLGQSAEAFRMLDEVMLGVVAGHCSPLVTGLVYCSVLEGCHEAQEVRRATTWTTSLTEWCGTQPDLVAFTDQCLAHRSEVLRLQGEWEDALAEAKRSHENNARGPVAAQASYQLAEIYRVQGRTKLAERTYHDVALRSGEPQPGLALLLLSMGYEDAAVASIRRALLEKADLLERVRILPGFVEVMLETGHIEDAAEAVDELQSIAERTGIDMQRAWAATARGTSSLAQSEPLDAVPHLRLAMRIYEDLGLPYELARSRRELGRALRALGDEQSALVQLKAAEREFEELGAAPDATSTRELMSIDANSPPHGLTTREVEVLAQLASGATNRAIAELLVLSERTIDRHVSNIFTKLGVSTRSAATAFAIRNDVV